MRSRVNSVSILLLILFKSMKKKTSCILTSRHVSQVCDCSLTHSQILFMVKAHVRFEQLTTGLFLELVRQFRNHTRNSFYYNDHFPILYILHRSKWRLLYLTCNKKIKRFIKKAISKKKEKRIRIRFLAHGPKPFPHYYQVWMRPNRF